MHKELNFSSEKGGDCNDKFDDDGRIKRTGTWMNASMHIITTVIGSGVLSLSWCFAQLGWIAGTVSLLVFAFITLYTCVLLSDSYRYPDPVTGTRNYTYMQAVKTNLGGFKYKFCGIIRYGCLVGATIGYTITSAIAWLMEIVLSQIPNIHKLTMISTVATIMSFAYSIIGIGLSIAKITGGRRPETSLTGIPVGKDFSSTEKMWNVLSSIGDIAFAFSFSPVLIEIQDTLKSSPAENKAMRKASTVGISAATMFYMLCGLLGYAAFGNDAPGNYLTGFGFYEPFWLIDLGNLFIVIHLLGADQILIQPFFGFVESWIREQWPESRFATKEYTIGNFGINILRLTWRTVYVILATLVAMIFPFFNNFLGLIGAAMFWPLTVYLPVEMHISQARIRRNSFTWIWLKVLSLSCLTVTLLAAAASIRGLAVSVQTFKILQSVS